MVDIEQANTEARAMAADLASAETLTDLDALYVNWIGYSVVEDDAEATIDSVREILRGYIDEFCADTGATLTDPQE